MYIVSARGMPETPSSVAQRLAAVSPRLSVQWIAGAAGGYWGLLEQWRPDDPRWQRVNTGEIAPEKARDLIHIFPRDIRPDAMNAYVETHYGSPERANPDPVKLSREIVDAHMAKNAAVKQAHEDAFLMKSETQAKSLTDHDRRMLAGVEAAHPMVAGFGESAKKRKVGK